MRTRVSSKGQIVLPAEIRQQDGIEPGQEFDVVRIEPGQYELRRLEQPPNSGLVDLLLHCPAKDWFQPLSRSETTAEVQPPGVE
jgi:AbrB family looped-hinge helix DNA binding protein